MRASACLADARQGVVLAHDLEARPTETVQTSSMRTLLAALVVLFVSLAASAALADAVPACPVGLRGRPSHGIVSGGCVPDGQAIASIAVSCACPLILIYLVGLGANRVRSRGD
jgi:hypothetical protein